jgi:predicted RNA-binding Zn ribbon-like protein
VVRKDRSGAVACRGRRGDGEGAHVLFSHDTERALECVVELVNSAPSSPAADDSDDALPDLPSLARFVRRHRLSELGELTPRDLAGVHAFRHEVDAVFDAADDEAAAEAVNALVSSSTVTPRLTDHDGYGWHVHYFAPGSSLTEHLRVECGMALIHVVASGERARLRRCAAPGCEHVLVDLSRNRSRRYCDARTCGNRLHVAAYRERRRAAGA